LQAARRYCPRLELSDLANHACGIRAQAVTARGELVSDFLIEQTARSVHVCNAPSPAATSAFPIADALVARIAAARA
ncbi:MAG: L-2-hydroxyglutarate oxidase, partial [Gammaproteobacteria bacterium]